MSKQEPKSPGPITIAGIEISVADQSPLVLALLGVIQKQAAEIQDLRDEIQRLKKTTLRPIIKPSRMLKPTPDDDGKDGTQRKRPGSAKRNKTKTLRIDSDEIISPDELPRTPNWKVIETLSFKISSWSLATRATAEPFTALPMGLSLSAGDPLVSIRTSVPR